MHRSHFRGYALVRLRRLASVQGRAKRRSARSVGVDVGMPLFRVDRGVCPVGNRWAWVRPAGRSLCWLLALVLGQIVMYWVVLILDAVIGIVQGVHG